MSKHFLLPTPNGLPPGPVKGGLHNILNGHLARQPGITIASNIQVRHLAETKDFIVLTETL